MTTIEQLTLDSMISLNPNIQLLITRLGLDTSYRTNAEIHSSKVNNRIEQILKELQYSPVKPRSITTTIDYSNPMISQSAACIEAYLTSIYGPKPWKYPLTSAPF